MKTKTMMLTMAVLMIASMATAREVPMVYANTESGYATDLHLRNTTQESITVAGLTIPPNTEATMTAWPRPGVGVERAFIPDGLEAWTVTTTPKGKQFEQASPTYLAADATTPVVVHNVTMPVGQRLWVMLIAEDDSFTWVSSIETDNAYAGGSGSMVRAGHASYHRHDRLGVASFRVFNSTPDHMSPATQEALAAAVDGGYRRGGVWVLPFIVSDNEGPLPHGGLR